MRARILLFLAEGFEEVEAITPLDFLRRAELEVVTAGIGSRQITGTHGITVMADCLLGQQNGEFDALVVPGGMPGSANIAASSEALTLLKEYNRQCKLIAAICAAPAVVLMQAGLLDGLKVTGYPSTKAHFSGCTYVDQPVVVDGNIITSQGAGTAALFALKIIEILAGSDAAQKIKKSTLQLV